MRRPTRWLIVSGVLAAATTGFGQTRVDPKAIQAEVSAAEIYRTLRAINVDRTGGSSGERTAVDYVSRKLGEYGIRHTAYETRLFLSWPGRAELSLPGLPPIVGKTAAFAASTPNDGVTRAIAELTALDLTVPEGASKTLNARRKRGAMIVLIDNYDSFTFNLVHYLGGWARMWSCIAMTRSPSTP